MNLGSLLSHGSIVAREYGIPAVVNVGPATRIIANGQRLLVDGDRGDRADTGQINGTRLHFTMIISKILLVEILQ